MNSREETFCKLFVTVPNASEAFRNAGYAPLNADVNSSLLMKKSHIKARIAELENEQFSVEKLAADLGVITENLVNQIANVRDIMIGQSPWMIPLHQMDPSVAACVDEQDVDAVTGLVARTRFHKRMGPLRSLARATGLLDAHAKDAAPTQMVMMRIQPEAFDAYVDSLHQAGKKDILQHLIEHACRDNVQLEEKSITRANALLEKMV